MAQETLTIERFTCDRCGDTQDIPSGATAVRAQWGKVEAQGKQGAQILRGGYSADLCSKCCVSLAEWSKWVVTSPGIGF